MPRPRLRVCTQTRCLPHKLARRTPQHGAPRCPRGDSDSSAPPDAQCSRTLPCARLTAHSGPSPSRWPPGTPLLALLASAAAQHSCVREWHCARHCFNFQESLQNAHEAARRTRRSSRSSEAHPVQACRHCGAPGRVCGVCALKAACVWLARWTASAPRPRGSRPQERVDRAGMAQRALHSARRAFWIPPSRRLRSPLGLCVRRKAHGRAQSWTTSSAASKARLKASRSAAKR